ncbi:PQQ-binding-like beta-propeller repeat protein [Streptomyces anulatus]|uniref:nSTAND1 domain-containing NTPase n=1 Tax=Streptomyces anulatus TaxID=1892 RepID=UPI00386444D4
MRDEPESAAGDGGTVRNEVSGGSQGTVYQGRDFTWIEGGSHIHVRSQGDLIPEGAWSDCPYLGLAPFRRQHARVFYGRDTLAERLVERLMTRLPQGVLVVVGASGAGKSSLLQAGMLPLLARGELGRWPVLSMTPSDRPLWELAHGLADLAGVSVASVHGSLRDDPRSMPQLMEQVIRATRTPTDMPTGVDANPGGGGPAPRLVLVIDQLEELFTLAQKNEHGREERAAFFAALQAATTPAEPGGLPGAMVVAAVRGDFLDQALRFPLLAEAIDAEVFAITPMSEAELRSAVTGPAAEAGLGVDEAVVDAVVAEVRSDDPATEGFGAGVLPLVSQAMYAAWGHREPGGDLDLRAYRRGGGTTDAVNRSAQSLYDGLTPEEQKIAGAVFTLLTIVAPDGRLARRHLSVEQLRAACATEPAEVDAVVTKFAADRLLVTDGTGVEIAHDVLLTSWHRLTAWLEGDRLDRALHSQLLTDTTTWLDHDKHKAYLYPAARLAEARAAADRWTADPERYPQPTADATEFLLAGHHTARRGTRIRRTLITVLAVLTATSITLAAVTSQFAERELRAATEASRQHAVALSRQLAAESLNISTAKPVTARRLAASAWHVSPTNQAREAMAHFLNEQQRNGMLPASPDTVAKVAFSSDGNLLATANGDDGTVGLWNPTTGEHLRRLPANPDGYVNGVEFSPVGNLLATTNQMGTVGLWNPTTGEHLHQLPANPDGEVADVAFSRDGSLLATANEGGTVGLWNPRTGKPVREPLPSNLGGHVLKVAFSPDGSLLAAANHNGVVRLWNPKTGEPADRQLRAERGGQATGLAFSSDGKSLATAYDSTVELWDPETGEPAGHRILDNPGGRVIGAAFSLDGKLLAIANQDGTVTLWDPTTGEFVARPLPAGQGGGVNGVVFSPAGNLLATANHDGTVRLWNLNTGEPAGHPLPADRGGRVTGLAFSPAGDLFATKGDGTVGRWNPTTGEPADPKVPTDPVDQENGVVFGPTGKPLATNNGDGTVTLWNPRTGKPADHQIPTDPNNHVDEVAFSLSASLLATVHQDRTVKLWNVKTGKPADHQISTDPNNHVDAVVFSPTGNLLATIHHNETVGLWNPKTSRPVGREIPAAPVDQEKGVVFSPSGDLLATNDGHGTVTLWNPATGEPVGSPLPANPLGMTAAGGRPSTDPDGEVNQVVFSPDGSLLATANDDGTVYLARIRLFTDMYAALCSDVGAPTSNEWKEYASGEPMTDACAS